MYSVLGAKPILGCISRFGRFTVHRDYLRDLTAHLRSTYLLGIYLRDWIYDISFVLELSTVQE